MHDAEDPQRYAYTNFSGSLSGELIPSYFHYRYIVNGNPRPTHANLLDSGLFEEEEMRYLLLSMQVDELRG